MTIPMSNYPVHNATSGFGSLHGGSRKPMPATFLVPTMLTTRRTSSTYDMPRQTERTASSPAAQPYSRATEKISEAIMEIRRRSGLTWEELSELFDVSRRSVHYWANGKPPSTGHEWAIRKVLTILRCLDRGNQIDTRATLLAVDDVNEISILELLKSGRFEDALLLRYSEVRNTGPTPPRATVSSHQPQAPVLLLEAEQQRFESPGEARIAIPKRTTTAAAD